MDSDLDRLQRQAARRVEEAQRHARHVFEEHEGHPAAPAMFRSADPPPLTPRLYNRPPREEAPPPAPPTPPELPTLPAESSLLAALSALDSAQWMLLGLALLLFRAGCHTELLLAILYIAM